MTMRLSFSFFIAALLLPTALAGQTVPPVVAAPPASPDATREELLRQAREARKDTVQPYRPTTLEKWIAKIEPMVMPEAVGDTTFRRGFYPKFGGIAPGSGWAVGPGYRYEGMAGGLLDANVFARASLKRYWQVEGRLEMPRLNDGRTGAGVFARLRDMPQEDFYGFGPASANEQRVSYGLREFAAGGFATHRAGEALTFHAGADFIKPATREGGDRNYPSIEEIFNTVTLPGFVDEPDFIVLRTGASYDRTDAPGNPRRGPQHRVELSRWQSRGGASATFNAFTADLRQFIPFFNETRVIALRGVVWHTDPSAGAEVPLYYQPVLGGARAMRGYREFRFRDHSVALMQAEYRFQIIPGADGVVFYEAGSVGPSLGDLGSLKTDYGIGLRFGSADGVFLRLEGAFGTPESPRFYLKLSNAF
ncbi:MAG: BamA/TamA family outer membrane protein [Acidobacteriota bacterium]|nr:BamA/TamA family outer membrane protein [Acidobacteriota bacterium]